MARVRTAKHPSRAEIPAEEESQEIPDEEPARVLESQTVGIPFNQAELVRKAVAAGHEKPATGVPYIKAQFGVDIDPKYYSVAKSQLKKREAKSSFAAEPAKRGRKTTTSVAAQPTPVPKAAIGQPDLLESLETLKPLIAAMGAEKAHRLVDLLG